MKKKIILVSLVAFALLIPMIIYLPKIFLVSVPVMTNRPSAWAQPVLRKSGLPNLYQVSENLYRGAKPEAQGFEELKKMGVKTVINLEMFHSDEEKIQESQSGLQYEHIFMASWHPETEDVVKFLKIVTDKKKLPVFVHCYHGSDRTGTMVAIYRIVVQGWSKDQAMDELRNGGFGFHPIWANLEEFIRGLDIEKLKKEIALPSTSSPVTPVKNESSAHPAEKNVLITPVSPVTNDISEIENNARVPASTPTTTPVLSPSSLPLVGGDRDAHGCIGSAGYSWCSEKNKCLRVWEEPCE